MSAKSKTAIVTGGSRGLGRDMVLNLAKKGANIIFTYNSNQAEANKVVSEVAAIGQKAIAYQLDVSKMSSIDAFVRQATAYLQEHEGAPNFDYLVNNAGTGVFGFKGVYFLTQKLLPFMNDGGGIVNISTGLTRVSFPNLSAYASMKGAVETYTKFLAKELGSRKIRANVVAPGAIATDFGGGSNKTDENRRNAIAGITALGRVGVPEDIGGVVAFLCTAEAGWLNGQRIELSGGMAL
jgi:NAD(P)-dependent dehydrogenase (short-subunit alcohol dehydrogenase family)